MKENRPSVSVPELDFLDVFGDPDGECTGDVGFGCAGTGGLKPEGVIGFDLGAGGAGGETGFDLGAGGGGALLLTAGGGGALIAAGADGGTLLLAAGGGGIPFPLAAGSGGFAPLGAGGGAGGID